MRERFAAHGVVLQCPDLNAPDFSTLTATRMITQTETTIAGLTPGPIVLVGSSLGGFVALHTAARADARGVTARRVDRLVLLAPALDLGANRLRDLGEEGLTRWRATDRLDVFHYDYNEVRPVHYELYADASRYDSFRATVSSPMLIVQGRFDESVDPQMVARFAAQRPNVTLRLVDDDHQLAASLDTIWQETARFLGLPRRED